LVKAPAPRFFPEEAGCLGLASLGLAFFSPAPSLPDSSPAFAQEEGAVSWPLSSLGELSALSPSITMQSEVLDPVSASPLAACRPGVSQPSPASCGMATASFISTSSPDPVAAVGASPLILTAWPISLPAVSPAHPNPIPLHKPVARLSRAKTGRRRTRTRNNKLLFEKGFIYYYFLFRAEGSTPIPGEGAALPGYLAHLTETGETSVCIRDRRRPGRQ